MQIGAVPILAEMLKAYYQPEELQEICSLFDVVFDPEGEQPFFVFAKSMVTEIEVGNNRRCLETIISHLLVKCDERYANTSFETQSYHGNMWKHLKTLEGMLGEPEIARELTVTEGKPFTAKSEVREFLKPMTTGVVVVDNYVGHATLDCLREVQYPIRLLTGARDNCIASGFNSALKEFVGEGHTIEVRRHVKLHDRYLIFNERCWLVGSSLKDAGQKTFSVIEVVDGRAPIVKEVERKWKEAKPHSSES